MQLPVIASQVPDSVACCVVPLQPGVKYGTRSQTVLAVWRDGRVEQRERYVEKVRGPDSVKTAVFGAEAGLPDPLATIWGIYSPATEGRQLCS
jgi:uncharacterized protein with NRDE domain